jgi:hypothetical protein
MTWPRHAMVRDVPAQREINRLAHSPSGAAKFGYTMLGDHGIDGAMNAIVSGVSASSAATTSPSFSRSASWVKTINPPRPIASTAALTTPQRYDGFQQFVNINVDLIATTRVRIASGCSFRSSTAGAPASPNHGAVADFDHRLIVGVT